ncbi:MAG: response regulator transcription factor [Desulfobacterales bacterium]
MGNKHKADVGNAGLNAAKQKKTRVFLVDDHRVVVEGIRNYLADKGDFEVIGYSIDGRDAVRQVRALKPDIVIMDVFMPNFNGVEAAYEITKSGLPTKIVAYTMSSDKEHVLSFFRAGISGYVLKEDALEDLLRALEAVKSGGTYYSRIVDKHIRTRMQSLERGDAAGVTAPEDGIGRLSFREKEILPMLADGKNSREIAEVLHISPKTVESHKYNIMEKLGVSTVAALTKIAIKEKLIKIE